MNQKKFEITVTQEPTHYFVEISDVGSSAETTYRRNLKSEECDMANAEQRRFALTNVYFNLAETLRGRQFPQDTLVYDMATTPARPINPRYPDEAVATT